MLNQYKGKCTKCHGPVAPGEGDLVHSATGKWQVTHTGVWGQEMAEGRAALQAERAALESQFGADVSCWLSDDYGLHVGPVVYRSENYIVHQVHDSRMPERVC